MEYEGDRASWMPDEVSSECLLCRSRFTLTRRRHHCRACKRLVCGSCSSNELSLPMPLPSTDSASVGFLVGGLANIHGPAVTTMAMQRVCDECYSRMTGLPPPVREKRVMLLNGRGGRAAEGPDGQQLLLHTGQRSQPLVLKVWVGRACGVGGHGGEDGHGVHNHHHHSNPPVATGRTSWYCVVRLNREVVGQTSVQAYRGRWTAWEETLSASLRLPSTLGGPAACGSQQQLTLDVLEKGRKMNGDVLLGQARVPLAYALSGPASPTGTAPDLCTRLIDPNSSRDAGRLVLRVWVSDAGGEVGQSAAMALALLPPSPPALLALFPPGSPLFPFLFYRTPSGRVVPQHETVVDVFEDAQLSIKNSRVQRTRQGRLIVTTHRLLHLCHASPSEGSRAGLPSDMPSQLPLACLSSITVKAGGKATRGAPPVLEVTCKNQLTYLYQVQAPCDPLASPTSRASSSSSQGPLPSSLSDYSQLSPQPSPPLLPPAFEAEQLVARLRAVQEEVLWRQIEDDYAFPAGRSRFFPLATSPSPACSPARTTQPPTTDRQQEAGGVGGELDWMAEFSRQGVTDNPLWRISHVNKGSKLCPTYPEVLLVPVSVSDADLIKAAEFRSRARIPVITWICPVTGAALTRSSQPLTGLTSSANPADDKLLLAIRATAYVGHAMGDKYACVDLMEGSTIDDDSAWTEVVTTTAKDEEGGGGEAPAAQAEQGMEEEGEGSGPPGERQQEEEEETGGHDDVEGEEEGEEEPLLPTEEEMEALAASLEGQFFYDAEDHNASTGLLGSPFDEVVLSPHHGPPPPPSSSRPDPVLRILDARPMVNAMGNQLLGKGSEVISRLGGEASTTLEYLNVANIHVMRESYLTLLAACHEHSDDAFLSNLHESRWLHHVSQILKGALTVSRYLEGGDPVLVHCSDGWDRTSQLTFLSQLLMDPYYRTRAGFRVLVEKEWCQFSHQFRQRSGGDSEFSPIFIQAMDATWQLLRQFPTAFEFNERLLLLLVEAVYSRWFKNFMYDSEAERQAALHDDFTRHHHQHHHGGGGMASSSSAAYSVWDVVEGDPDAYRNVLYDCNAERRRSARGALQHLRPRPEVSRLALWRELYLRDHMRFAAERGPSRLSREQALEKRVLALEQQLGLGLAPLDARAAQEKIRDIAELAALLGKKAALVDDMITASVGGAATNGHSHAAPRHACHVARASSCVDVHAPPPHPAAVRKTRSLSPPTAAVPSSPPPPQAVVVKAAAAAEVSASGRHGHHQRKERSATS